MSYLFSSLLTSWPTMLYGISNRGACHTHHNYIESQKGSNLLLTYQYGYLRISNHAQTT